MRTIAITWENAHKFGEAWASHHQLRYRMFVARQRWNVPHYRQMEYDEFDTPAATYILVVDDHNRSLGTARLIPTTRPYMVEALWPHLVRGDELPHSSAIWEASRFGCDRDLTAANRRRVIAQLIHGCQEFGIQNGINRYLGVMPVWVFQHVIAAHGCPVTPLGPRSELNGHEIEAAYIGVSPSVLETVRRHAGLQETRLEQDTSPVVTISHPLSPSLVCDELPHLSEQPPAYDGETGFRMHADPSAAIASAAHR